MFKEHGLYLLCNDVQFILVDGFSPFPSILTYFPNLDDSNLPPHWDMVQSMSDVAPTVLMEVTTGKQLTDHCWS